MTSLVFSIRRPTGDMSFCQATISKYIYSKCALTTRVECGLDWLLTWDMSNNTDHLLLKSSMLKSDSSVRKCFGHLAFENPFVVFLLCFSDYFNSVLFQTFLVLSCWVRRKILKLCFSWLFHIFGWLFVVRVPSCTLCLIASQHILNDRCVPLDMGVPW